MLGVVVGWYLHRWWKGRELERTPPEVPVATYRGRLTLNHAVAGPLSTECEISEPDADGRRKLINAGKVIAQASHWVATFMGNQDGQLSMRFHKPCDALDAMRQVNIQDEFRLELYRTKAAEARAVPEQQQVQTYQPFGGAPGQGGMS